MKAVPGSISRKAKKLVKSPNAFMRDMKLLRWVKALFSSWDFSCLVVVPFIVAVVYLCGIAQERYVSESSFIVQSESSAAVSSNSISLLGLGGAGPKDERVIEEYIHSLDVLKEIDSELSLRSHYSSPVYDVVYRLSPAATQEKFLEYYRNHSKIYFDEARGILTMSVETFSPEFSKIVADKLLAAAEDFVNQYSLELANNQQKFVAKQVLRLERNLRKVKREILDFQNSNQILSPESEGNSLGSIVAALEAKLAEKKAEYRELLSYQQVSAPAPMAIKRQIEALQQQIGEEKSKLVRNDGSALNMQLAEYQQLKLDLEFATRSYESALTALEAARMEASRKLKHLITISKPQIAEDGAFPRKLYLLAVMLLVQMMAFALYRMIAATIREHQD